MTKEALKLALEALEKADRHCPVNTEAEVFVRLSITALREALAQPEQEPVACKTLCELCVKRGYTFCANAVKTTPIYTTPPQRTWVGLTEERIKDIWMKGKDHGDDWLDVVALARSFEAELKEKNT